MNSLWSSCQRGQEEQPVLRDDRRVPRSQASPQGHQVKTRGASAPREL